MVDTGKMSTPKKAVGLRVPKSVGVNPKDRIGALKVDFTLIPPPALLQLALAQMDGAEKYGEYNWRVEPVQIRTYLGAMMRHILSYQEGEMYDASGVHHLGHVMACCAIIIDGESHGSTTDNRPLPSDFALQLAHANDILREKHQQLIEEAITNAVLDGGGDKVPPRRDGEETANKLQSNGPPLEESTPRSLSQTASIGIPPTKDNETNPSGGNESIPDIILPESPSPLAAAVAAAFGRTRGP
jgi:hypothetical protein